MNAVETSDDDRRARYDEALQLRNECARRYLSDAPKLIMHLMDLLSDMMTTNTIVNLANADLPAGVGPIDRIDGFCHGYTDHGAYDTPAQLAAFRLTQCLLPDLAGGVAWPPGLNLQDDASGERSVLDQAAVNALWLRRQN